MKTWPVVPLEELLMKSEEWVNLDPLRTVTQVRVQWWGQGAVARRTATAGELGTTKWLVVHSDQFLISRIDARKGAAGIVPCDLDGAVVSNDFPAFNIDRKRLEPAFLGWYSKTQRFVRDCEAASEGTTNRVRLREDRFCKLMIPLPPLEEQRKIVEKIDSISEKIGMAKRLQAEVEIEIEALLMSAYKRIADRAPRRPLGEVAPLNRRPLLVESDKIYPQVAVRSFGKGTFHREALVGLEVTWEKPFVVESGDILISNIKAWEGAIAVATGGDHHLVCSHRYLTCVPIPEVATARFVCFHLLTREGLREIGEASPGSADRNRTLGAKALLQIPVPVPEYEKQLEFDEYSKRMEELRAIRKQTTAELESVIPALTAMLFGSA